MSYHLYAKINNEVVELSLNSADRAVATANAASAMATAAATTANTASTAATAAVTTANAASAAATAAVATATQILTQTGDPENLTTVDKSTIVAAVNEINSKQGTHETSIAPVYNAFSTYTVGAVCMYGGSRYKCITAIDPAEAWTPEHWATEAVQTAFNAHINNTLNPHAVTKAQVGLNRVDNTSDVEKPIGTATQNALDGKLALNGGVLTGNLTITGASSSLTVASGGISTTGTVACNDFSVSGSTSFTKTPSGTIFAITGIALSPEDGEVQYKTITANTAFTLSVPDVTKCYCFTIYITNAGACLVTFPNYVKWEQGTAPEFSVNGTDVVTLLYAGSTLGWVAKAVLNIKTIQ